MRMGETDVLQRFQFVSNETASCAISTRRSQVMHCHTFHGQWFLQQLSSGAVAVDVVVAAAGVVAAAAVAAVAVDYYCCYCLRNYSNCCPDYSSRPMNIL